MTPFELSQIQSNDYDFLFQLFVYRIGFFLYLRIYSKKSHSQMKEMGKQKIVMGKVLFI